MRHAHLHTNLYTPTPRYADAQTWVEVHSYTHTNKKERNSHTHLRVGARKRVVIRKTTVEQFPENNCEAEDVHLCVGKGCGSACMCVRMCMPVCLFVGGQKRVCGRVYMHASKPMRVCVCVCTRVNMCASINPAVHTVSLSARANSLRTDRTAHTFAH